MTINIEKLAIKMLVGTDRLDYYYADIDELKQFAEAYAAKVLEDKERDIEGILDDTQSLANELLRSKSQIAELQAEIEDKEREIAELKNWKKEVIAVENEWDEQLIGKALNIQLGNSIRANILPKINELQANNNRLCEALKYYADMYAISNLSDVARQALSKTPAQSLQSVINETIEMCAEEVEERGSRFEAEIIRALKDNYDR